MDRCPGVTVLATSRRPVLRSGAERLFEVPPLEAPPPEAGTVEELAANESVRLFVETASRIPRRDGPEDFRLDSTNAGPVARICRRLEGIPLAIELAAARFESLSVERIAGHLTQSLRLLKGGERNDPERHKTIRATLDWSHGLLPEANVKACRRRPCSGRRTSAWPPSCPGTRPPPRQNPTWMRRSSAP